MSQTVTREMHITRIFDAPRALVYRAFTDPEHLAAWFGPVGYSAPREEIVVELRRGGRERIVMVKDDDPTKRIELESVYTEIALDSLIAGHPVDDPEGAGNFRFEFSDEPDGKTRLDLRVWPVTEEWSGETSKGWESSFTKLDRLLPAPDSHDR
jgi:uncharacterized protein YndB with AHSA1/START domain